ncbi:MAG: LuxR C-terminal-related transcriptional regulator, partial [Anaerolineae bacterium]
AMAGSGKSTLLGQWLEDCPYPSAWLSLDQRDNDLAVFLSYVIGALQTVSPGACDKTLNLLEAHRQPPVEAIVTSLVNEMDEMILILTEPAAEEQETPPKGLVLVLDDYHHITDPAIHQAMSLLIEHLPQGMHLTLASRTVPLLPIPLLRARGQILEMRAGDLRFTLEEVEAFLTATFGLELSREAIGVLQEKSEGWIAGLQLAALSLRNLPDRSNLLQTLKGSSIYFVVEYLVHEVHSQQPEAIQEFLLRTSILDRFCAPLCEAVCCAEANTTLAPTGAGSFPEIPLDGQDYLETLERDNLFIVPLDLEHGWYRYHHLFQDVLRQELAKRWSAEEIATLHARAGAWFASQGYVEEALQHDLAAGDMTGAAKLVEAYAHKTLDQDRFYTLSRWLRTLPDELVRQRPGLLLAKAWTLQHQLNLQALRPLVQAAEALLDSGAPQLEPRVIDALRAEADYFRGMFAYWLGDAQRSLVHCQRALECLPKSYLLARAQAGAYQGLAYQMAGQKDIALRVTNQGIYEHGMSSDLQTHRFQVTLTLIRILSGDLYEAAQSTDASLKAAERGKLANSIGWSHYIWGLLHYEWNDLLSAAQHFSDAIDLRYAFQPRATVDSYSGLSLTLQAQGQGERASAVAESLLRFALEAGNPTLLALARSLQARLSLLQGDIEPALRWLQGASHEVEVEPLSLWLENTVLTRTRVLITLGASGTRLPDEREPLRAAVDILAAQQQIAGAKHNTVQMIRVLSLQALAYDALDQEDEALDALKEAVMLARPGGFVRTFVDTGPAMVSLFHRLAEQNIAPEYVGRVVAALQYLQMGDTKIGKLAAPLSRREMEVLALLARQMINKEIARELSVSPATVKTHTLNIYRKLEVPNRQQAVDKARALGILPPQ